jgi:hypothetical protein
MAESEANKTTEDVPEDTDAPGYKPPEFEPLEDILKKDQEDESLNKYKQTLLGGLADVKDPCMSSINSILNIDVCCTLYLFFLFGSTVLTLTISMLWSCQITCYSFFNAQSYARQLNIPFWTAALGMYSVLIPKDLVGSSMNMMISRLKIRTLRRLHMGCR